MEHKYCKYLLILLIGVLISFVIFSKFCYSSMDELGKFLSDDIITFSKKSGFYNHDIKIKIHKNIEVPSKAEVYFTVNGGNPTINSFKYDDSIMLQYKPDKIRIFNIKAALYYKGEFSPIVSQTYIIGDSIEKQLKLPIINLSMSDYDLYDYYKGIFALGYHYDKAVAEGLEHPGLHANYAQNGDEWIKDAHMTMIGADGSFISEQDIKVSVAGNSSHTLKTKSLKLEGRNLSSGKQEKLQIWQNNQAYSPFSLVKKHNSLRLRNGGQDFNITNIRSSVVNRLAEQAGFEGYSGTQRCIVFINGKFYGIFDLQQTYSKSYLKNRFNLPNSKQVERYKGAELRIFDATDLNKYFQADLTKLKNRQALESLVDMQNFLHYYAINILCNNTDWPMNNYQVWRFAGKSNSDNPYSDGRFRFLMYDLDLTWNNGYNSYIHFEGDNKNILESLVKVKYRGTPTFANVMKSKEYRDQFLTILEDLRQTVFTNENILKIIQEEKEKIQFANLEFLSASELAALKKHTAILCEGIFIHNEQLQQLLEKYFNAKEKYTLNVKGCEGITLSWSINNLFGQESYSVRYIKDVSFKIKQQAHLGYRFVHWIVNGKIIKGDILTITPEMTQTKELLIQAVAERSNNQVLAIQEISARGTKDWIKLTNFGLDDIQLKNYYLSDSPDNLSKFQLPNKILKSGESIIINGKWNYFAIKEYICNFNLKEGEMLYLTKNGTIVDFINIPRMDSGESYGRYKGSNRFVFYNNQNNRRHHI